MITLEQILGICDTHIDYSAFEVPVNKHVVSVLKELKDHAQYAGFELAFASGYRSFDRQKLIWNAKATGKRPVLDKQGQPIDISLLPPKEQLNHILYWSALPGLSRHHWGTEIDIYDKSALGENALALTVQETQKGGIFEDMYIWLDMYLSSNNFLRRPYLGHIGRVAKEPWHLSVVTEAQPFEALMTLEAIRPYIEAQGSIALHADVMKHFDDIYAHYIAPYFI